jgi:hypothetical protein
VAGVAAVLVMHGGLDARALVSHLPVSVADEGRHAIAPARESLVPGGAAEVSAPAAELAGGHQAHADVGAPAGATDDQAAHGHGMGHLLAACAAVLLVVGVLGLGLALRRPLLGGRSVAATRTSALILWAEQRVPLPPPRVALCVERC